MGNSEEGLPDKSPKSHVRSGAWATLQQFANLAYNGLLIVTAARLLSISDFGALNYALTGAALAISISSAGFYGLAIREYANHPERSAMISSTVVAIRETVAIVSYVVLVAIGATTTDGAHATLAVAIAGAAVFARAFDVAELWFQSRLEAKTPALLKIVTGAAFLGVKVLVLFLAPSVVAVVTVYLIEQSVYVVILIRLYSRRVTGLAWQVPSFLHIRRFADGGLPLLISSIANQINLRVDIIIIQAIMGSTAVGIYSAAARVSEIAYVLPVVYMNATFPSLLAVRRQSGANSAEYRGSLQRAVDGSLWLGVAVSVVIILAAPIVVPLLFGPEFEGSVGLLQVMALACPAIFLGAVVSKWIVAEDRLWLSFWRHAVGAALNIMLTIALVPQYGLIAAAWSTVASYVLANVGFLYIGHSTRRLGVQVLIALLAPIRFLRARLTPRKGRGLE